MNPHIPKLCLLVDLIITGPVVIADPPGQLLPHDLAQDNVQDGRVCLHREEYDYEREHEYVHKDIDHDFAHGSIITTMMSMTNA